MHWKVSQIYNYKQDKYEICLGEYTPVTFSYSISLPLHFNLLLVWVCFFFQELEEKWDLYVDINKYFSFTWRYFLSYFIICKQNQELFQQGIARCTTLTISSVRNNSRHLSSGWLHAVRYCFVTPLTPSQPLSYAHTFSGLHTKVVPSF